MTNKTITIFIHQIISSILDSVLWKLLYSLDQRKGGKVSLFLKVNNNRNTALERTAA